MKKNVLVSLAITILFSTLWVSVYAMDLKTARKKGLVGENRDGFINPVKTGANTDVMALVKAINNKRKEHFVKIAKKYKGQSYKDAGKSSHKTIINGLPAGSYYKNASDSWVRK